MTFMPPISAPLVAPIATPGGAVAIPWYLLGGVTAGQCVAAYQPKGAADLAASYVNLAHPGTNDAAPGTAPTFAAATGWTFAAASSQYLTTGITPTSGWSALVRISGSSVPSGACPYGAAIEPNYFAIQPNISSKVTYYSGSSGGGLLVSPNITSGDHVLGTAGQTGYRDGVAESGTIGAWTGSVSTLYIGCFNYNGTRLFYWNENILALSIYNITISSTQVGLISAAMAAL